MTEDDGTLPFSALRGQYKAKRLLKRMLDSGRVGHAYLFRGPDGVGKRLCAELLAARLNCQAPGADGGCGTCASCRKYRSGNHPDSILIRPEGGTIKIDRIRELIRSLAFPPYESGVRVIVIEDIHTMRAEAANSLLKTLEEPPEKNVLILTAESSRALLPTIASRCQATPFYGLSAEETRDILRERDPAISAEEAALLARMANGSPGQALVLREQGIVEISRVVLDSVKLPPEPAGAAITELLRTAEMIASLKENITPLLGLLRLWVRDSMVESSGSGSRRMREHLARLRAIDRAERQLARNCNRTLVCEVLLFDLQSPMPRVSL